MKVFKASVLVLRKRLPQLLVFMCIFLALSGLMAQLNGSSQQRTGFIQTRSNFALIDHDNTALTRGLHSALLAEHEEIPVAENKEAMQDALFQSSPACIFVAPKGFTADFLAGKPTALETLTMPNAQDGYQLRSQAEQYLSLARTQYALNPALSQDTLVKQVQAALDKGADAEVASFGTGGSALGKYGMFLRMVAYYLINMAVLCVCIVLMPYQQPDLRMRNLCAPLKPRSMSLQSALCGSVATVVSWLVITLCSVFAFRAEIQQADPRIWGLTLLNSFACMLLCLSVALLASQLVNSFNRLMAVSNSITLGLCFLSGAFVPVEYLGEGVRTVAQFTPIYWYIKGVTDILGLTSIDAAALQVVQVDIGIQLVFAAALLCVGLALGKLRARSRDSFGSSHTEFAQ